MTFTPADCNPIPVLRIRGVQEFTADGNQQFFVVTSAGIGSDRQYARIHFDDIEVKTIDSGVN